VGVKENLAEEVIKLFEERPRPRVKRPGKKSKRGRRGGTLMRGEEKQRNTRLAKIGRRRNVPVVR